MDKLANFVESKFKESAISSFKFYNVWILSLIDSAKLSILFKTEVNILTFNSCLLVWVSPLNTSN